MGVVVLLLSPLQTCTGNYATVCRIRKEIEERQIRCLLACPTQFSTPCQLCKYVRKNNISVVVGIHAYKSGRLLIDLDVPYILILGGTDINGSATDDVNRTMTSALENASGIVSFSQSVYQQFRSRWPMIGLDTTSIIPQAVCVTPSSFKVKEYIHDYGVSFGNHNISDKLPVVKDIDTFRSFEAHEVRLFSIVGGIRPVKNPLFVVNKFSEWRSKTNRHHCFMLIIGHSLDEDYFKHFYEVISQLSGVIFISGLERDDCHAAIRDSFALVNSSESEGMALAILEGMALGVPVIVRGVAGNRAIVEDGHTGLVFDTADEFINKSSLLLEDPGTLEMITHNASVNISQKHMRESEAAAYVNLIHSVFKRHRIALQLSQGSKFNF